MKDEENFLSNDIKNIDIKTKYRGHLRAKCPYTMEYRELYNDISALKKKILLNFREIK